jgi:hypothetical protein
VKQIEILVRSDAWDRETKAAFLAWLDKPMRDDARLGYCQRKAWFMLNGEKPARLRAALKLLDWALATFATAEPRTKSLARIVRGQLRAKLQFSATPR